MKIYNVRTRSCKEIWSKHCEKESTCRTYETWQVRIDLSRYAWFAFEACLMIIDLSVISFRKINNVFIRIIILCHITTPFHSLVKIFQIPTWWRLIELRAKSSVEIRADLQLAQRRLDIINQWIRGERSVYFESPLQAAITTSLRTKRRVIVRLSPRYRNVSFPR